MKTQAFSRKVSNSAADDTSRKEAPKLSEELPATAFSSLDNDFRADVTAAEKVESGTPEDRILIQSMGALKRPFRRDVEAIDKVTSEYTGKDYVVIKTPKEGIYDMLPEGLFHQPSAHIYSATEKELIKAIKARKAEEEESRLFFLPFEAAFGSLRIQMALYEAKLDKRTHYDELVRIFRGQWEIFRYLDTRQADLFLHLIPILHDIRDDYVAIETILELVFELPVRLTVQPQAPVLQAEPVLSRMGESLLGIDFTTGNAVHDEGVDEFLIKIGPLSGELFQTFMPGGTNHKILELLYDYLLPVHLDVVTELELHNTDRVVRFVEGKNVQNSVLGTDTYL